MSTSTLQVARVTPEQLESRACTESNQFRDLITTQDVKTILARALACPAEVLDFSVLPYSDGKLGFLGTHQRLRVTARTKNRTETHDFFVKFVPYNVPTQAEYVLAKGVFEKEIFFYRELLPLLCESYEGESCVPLCYMVKKDAMIFEDLGRKGYTMRDKLFDKEHVEAGLSSIARLHAMSLLAESRLGRRLDEVYPRAFTEKTFERVGKAREWLEAGVNAAIAVAKELGLDASRISEACESVYESVLPSNGRTNVVSHGDLWGNNLMFNDDRPPKCLLIDFQLLRYCVLAHDVIGFLYLCASRDFRANFENEMVRHYYEVLRQTLESSKSSTARKIPDWSEVLEGVEEQRLCASVTAVLFFPTVLMDENLCAEILNDPVSYNEYTFRNRDEVVLRNMRENKVYRERMTETVTELVELASRRDSKR